MENLLRRLADAPADEGAAGLAALVDAIRPGRAGDVTQATSNLRALTYLVTRDAPLRAALARHLLSLLARTRQVRLYSDTGVFRNEGFFGAAARMLGHRVLPEEVDLRQLQDAFGHVFHRPDDHEWVAAVDDEVWLELLAALRLEDVRRRPEDDHTPLELLEACLVLSYRISAIGLEPELVRNAPELEHADSPFLAQNLAVRRFADDGRAQLAAGGRVDGDDRQIHATLGACEQVIEQVRRHAMVAGTSVSLTYDLQRLTQSIRRLRQLVTLVDPTHAGDRGRVGVGLFKELVRAENRKNSVGDLFRTTTDLVARRVTENAGRTGEHYITSTRREWLGMLKSAAGGGVLIAFMASLKVLSTKLGLAPIPQALVFSLDYALGFMLIHVLHGTVATKQPAMTAAAIAASIEAGGKDLAALTELVVKTARTQFIAILGNVVVAVPLAFGLAVGFEALTGANLAKPAKAALLLHELDPIRSLALPHAAIAGVCLFLAGLISGYYDNKAAYERIPERLRQRRLLVRLLGAARVDRFARYIEHNLGALAGNFYFGFMLGSIGTVGAMVGLPLDIRHIAFSSANLSLGLVGHDGALPWQTVALAAAGVALIGLTNLAVSFTLAVHVALKSRRLRFGQTRVLVRGLLRHNARDFFLPPKEEPVALVASTAAPESDGGAGGSGR